MSLINSCRIYRKTIPQVIVDTAFDNRLSNVFCSACGWPVSLFDAIEERFESAELKRQVRESEQESTIAIDNESRELILKGDVNVVAGHAGQIYRGYTNSDWGIDGEIEFKDDRGQASGRRLYLQLKSGDSYLKRRRDGEEIFQIKNARWIEYWQQHEYPVMLVIRRANGEILWMNVTEYLRNRSLDNATERQIVFKGDRFDVTDLQKKRREAFEKI